MSALCQKRTHALQQKGLFDQLVGGDKQALRDGDAERLRCLEIDNQFDLGGLLDGKIGRLLAFENTTAITPAKWYENMPLPP